VADWTVADAGDLTGRLALVTGANAGLGFEISRILADRGADVLVACRNQERAASAVAAITKRAPRGTVEARPLDLASLRSVASLADSLNTAGRALDLLVNNAGVMAVDEGRTEDGFETTFGVNHLGHFALTLSLLGLLERAERARVVTMSSMGHRAGRLHLDDPQFQRRPYRRWAAYLQSKLCNLLFSAELARKLGPRSSVLSVAAHPGASNTTLGFDGGGFTNAVLRTWVPYATQSAAHGALPAIRAATDPMVRPGEFYGPRYVYFGATPVRETPSHSARSVGDARALWALSEALTGVTFSTRGAATAKPSFAVVWDRVVASAGSTFRLIRGGEFTYEVRGDSLALSRTKQSLSRGHLAEAYELTPLASTVPLQHLRSPSYLFAILMDPRISKGEW
jgi:NAD(P)-dependent dehydrogenase (short-subunit alcohol dehydrogenase family)